MPQPGDDRLAEIYGESYYEPWTWETEEKVHASKASTFRRALQLARPRVGERVLDVGCAQGEFAALASAEGLHVVGVDINADAIERARKLVPEAQFECAELDPALLGSDWELVTMFDFIEHVRDPRDTLARARSVVSGSGRLLISTPWVGSLAHRLLGRAWPQYREEHLVLFSKEGLLASLRGAGFTVEALVPTVKFSTGAYLLGQLATYGPTGIERLMRPLRWTLRFPPMHRPIPMRFGEMTVLARPDHVR